MDTHLFLLLDLPVCSSLLVVCDRARMGVPFLVHVCVRRWRFWEFWSSVSSPGICLFPVSGADRSAAKVGPVLFAWVSDDFWSVCWVLGGVGIVL